MYTLNSFTVTAPQVDTIGVSAFEGTKVSTITLGTAGEEPGVFAAIGSKAFYGCSSLTDLYILWENYTIPLDNVDALNSVPSLKIHVPAALLSEY